MRNWLSTQLRPLPLAALIAVSGCGESGLNSRQRDEVIDLASESAAVVVYDSEKVAELESEIDDLEGQIADLQGRLDDLESRLDYASIY